MPEPTRDAIRDVCDRFDGFNYGRLDLELVGPADGGLGSLCILEINGTQSTLVEIFDCQVTLFKAYSIYFAYIRDAVNIGLNNINRKGTETGIVDIMGGLGKYVLSSLYYCDIVQNVSGAKDAAFRCGRDTPVGTPMPGQGRRRTYSRKYVSPLNSV